jgi:sugar lactone lactonase YvrE
VWLASDESVYWVDAAAHEVWWWRSQDGSTGRQRLTVPVTALVPREQGGWILVTQDGVHASTSDFASIEPLVDPTKPYPGTQLNDGVADRWGRLWTGSVSRTRVQDPVGHLYVIDQRLGVTDVDDGFANANGIAFSPDGRTAYVSDMFNRRIRAYRLDAGTARVEPLPAIATDGPGYPDGLTVDRHGFLWVAYWAGARLERLDPAGAVAATVRLPVEHVTRCCFGGPAWSRLFVTSARFELEAGGLDRQPLAGALFSMAGDIVGMPAALADL